MPTNLEILKSTEDHELYLHILARSILFRRKTYESGFLQPWQVADALCKFFGIDEGWGKPPTEGKYYHSRTDVFISRIFESKPRAIFAGIADEDYAEAMIGWIHMIKWVENLPPEDVVTVTNLVLKYGK